MRAYLRTSIAAATLGFAGLFVFSDVGAASGGVVKFKTDNGPDGYYYNANGAARARYCSYYFVGEFDGRAVICGMRIRDLDQSSRSLGVDVYTLGGDLRSEDGNRPGYADISTAGLVATTDLASRGSCSTTGATRTYTFGGGAGVPDPMTAFLLTAPQAANNNLSEGIDFCGILLDTSSVFSNSARTQAYSVAENPLYTSIGFNHFLEAIVLEPKDFDLNLRMTGSSRFPGDRGLPVMFARRVCDLSQVNCVAMNGDVPVSTTDDFVTARIALDNATCSTASTVVTITADRSPINPKLGPRVVTPFFRPCGGGAPILHPMTLPAKSRTILCLEIKTAISRQIVNRFPVDLPFTVIALDANNLTNPPFDLEDQLLGLRPSSGYYDNDSHGAFFFSQTPVQTGDNLGVRTDAIDLPKPGNVLRISGVQVVGGEFGTSGLTGLDGIEVRREDPVIVRNPDLSPEGLIRGVAAIGDPGNSDGLPMGLAATTLNVDFTDFVTTVQDPALAENLFTLAYLNPGETGAMVTAIGATGGGDTFVGNSGTILGGIHPTFPFSQNDLEIRLDLNGELGNPTVLEPARRHRPVSARPREVGRFQVVRKGGEIVR